MIDPLLARTTKRLPSCEKDTLPRVILDTSTPPALAAAAMASVAASAYEAADKESLKQGRLPHILLHILPYILPAIVVDGILYFGCLFVIVILFLNKI